MRYLIVRCHYQLVNRTSKYFLPHIVKGEGLETSQFVFYSPVLGNLNTISLNLKIKSAVAYSRSSTIDFQFSISDHFDWLETGWHRE
jgi:hypothetical protein